MFAHIVASARSLVPTERQFDFGTWPGNITAQFTIRVRAAGGVSYENTYELLPGCSIGFARNALMDHLKTAGWTVRPIGDGAFALRGPKTARVQSVELSAVKTWAPLVTVVPVVPKPKK